MGEWKDNAMWRHPMPQGKTERERQLELDLEQAKAENLRQEVAKMNKEQECWQQAHIQAAIEFAAQILANHGGAPTTVAKDAVDYADALVAELQKKGGNNANKD